MIEDHFDSIPDGIKIAVIGTHQDFAKTIAECITGAFGWKTYYSFDGIRSLPLIEDVNPDVIFMSPIMCRMNGYELTDLISVRKVQSRVVMLTGLPIPHPKRAAETGACVCTRPMLKIQMVPTYIHWALHDGHAVGEYPKRHAQVFAYVQYTYAHAVASGEIRTNLSPKKYGQQVADQAYYDRLDTLNRRMG